MGLRAGRGESPGCGNDIYAGGGRRAVVTGISEPLEFTKKQSAPISVHFKKQRQYLAANAFY